MGELVMPDHYQKVHCEVHSGNIKSLETHKDQIGDLYDKHNDMKDIMAEIRTSIATLTLTMDNGFREAGKAVQDLSCDIKKMNEQREKTIKYYDDIVVDFRKQMLELEKFKWFRDWMNKSRDKLPKFLFWLIMSAFGALIMIHQLDIFRFFRKG